MHGEVGGWMSEAPTESPSSPFINGVGHESTQRESVGKRHRCVDNWSIALKEQAKRALIFLTVFMIGGHHENPELRDYDSVGGFLYRVLKSEPKLFPGS